MNVPICLDGATVVCYSDNVNSNNFGFVSDLDINKDIIITGLAIGKYPDAEGYYLFSCDINWNVIGDLYFLTLEEAIEIAEVSYDCNKSQWIVREFNISTKDSYVIKK